jgi:hypothetical protein
MGLTMLPLLCLGILPGHSNRGEYEFTRGRWQAAHAALQKLDRMSHVHFTNREVLSSLRLEINGDPAATAFEGRA